MGNPLYMQVYSWEKQRTEWQFLIAMLNYQSVYIPYPAEVLNFRANPLVCFF